MTPRVPCPARCTLHKPKTAGGAPVYHAGGPAGAQLCRHGTPHECRTCGMSFCLACQTAEAITKGTPGTYRVTHTTMIQTDGTRTFYAVYAAPLTIPKNPRRRPSINLNAASAEKVGVVETFEGHASAVPERIVSAHPSPRRSLLIDAPTDYLAMAEAYATSTAAAFDFDMLPASRRFYN